MYKDLLVHVDATQQGERRVAAAASLASALDAHLTGLYVIGPAPSLVSSGAIPIASEVAAVHAAANAPNPMRDALEATARRFSGICEGAGVRSTWHATEGPIPPAVTFHARFHDLTIVGQDASDPDPLLPPPGLPADIAIESGRPALVIPYLGSWERIGTRVTVAWNASRESACALHDALPLLERAEEVRVITVVEPGADDFDPSGAGLDIVENLRRNGIETTWRRDPSDLDVAEEILARMGDQACDLLVMGAYGHSRLRELVFGGTTREMLAHMTAPVLLAS